MTEEKGGRELFLGQSMLLMACHLVRPQLQTSSSLFALHDSIALLTGWWSRALLVPLGRTIFGVIQEASVLFGFISRDNQHERFSMSLCETTWKI